MAQAHDATVSRHITRRAPNGTHSDAVQEAKRLEKMQSHGSSHGGVGAAPRPAPAKDAQN